MCVMPLTESCSLRDDATYKLSELPGECAGITAAPLFTVEWKIVACQNAKNSA